MSGLVGQWRTDPKDKITIEKYGNVTLEFSGDGKLIYTIHEEDKEQKMFLTYRIQGDFLISNQPSKPSEEKTKFKFTPNGKLLLFFGGDESKYIKVSD